MTGGMLPPAGAAPAEPPCDGEGPKGWSLKPGRARWISAIAWVLALAAIGHLILTAVSGQMLDLGVYRAGGQAVLHGRDLYSIRAADRLPFTYPPVSAILAVPLALVPFGVAKLLWVAVVYLPLAAAVHVGFRETLRRTPGAAPAVYPALLAVAAYLVPVRQEIGYGQVDLLLLGLCLLDCVTSAPRWPRGLLIGLAAAIKLEPGVFLIYLLITGRRREAGTAALSFLCFTGLAWLVSPSDSAAYWTSAIFHTGRLGGNGSAANQALRGMVLRLLRHHPGVNPDLVWIPLALIVGIAGFAAARASWRGGREMAAITITGLLGALLSPVAWIHHLCWVVLAIGVILGDGRVVRRVMLALLTGILFLTSLPTWAEHTMSQARLAPLPGFLSENSFGLAALALIPVLFYAGRHAKEPETAVIPNGERDLARA